MRAEELKKDYDGYLCSCHEYENWERYKIPLQMGRCLPCNAFQVRYFIKNQINIARLNRDDVDVLEALFNKYGMAGDYEERDRWIWLLNQEDLKEVLKLKYKV